ncbi:glucuronate isomerase [Shouchella hunanensis]|uniref:Uronate isomerase n=1 Tax=Shouchella hunanensis TaxID=766894 RepID=A0ABY7W6U3_9BACI|nr:glucuronate isomerase [Shouchella hunanensis]WDF03344.1 glucuronate isomerase [Shouchella hunanensis]
MFIHENFMLQNEYAKTLYHDYAKTMPIYDFHSHLDPESIANDKSYETITELWLGDDHYKWRAMRACGIEERLITGPATDKEKFFAWARTVPQLLGNPLYHWTHMELTHTFGISTLLSEETAESIWQETNRQLQEKKVTVRSLLQQANVDTLCTTDQIIDSLEEHVRIAQDKTIVTKVLPTFRADAALQVGGKNFRDFLGKLENVTGIDINNVSSYLQALTNRIDYFHERGCRASDHGIGQFRFEKATVQQAEELFTQLLQQKRLNEHERTLIQSIVLEHLGKAYADKGWVMQLHIGPLRNNNSAAFDTIGPDSGFDSIQDDSYAISLNRFFNELEQLDKLPKTICFNLDWTKNEMIAGALGNFQKEGLPGKMQLGSGWWFNDTKDGMRRQMTSLASVGVLSHFVGMLTDSRSFLSFARHDYFRRILCQFISEWMEDGEIPANLPQAGKLIQAISYQNAKRYFES